MCSGVSCVCDHVVLSADSLKKSSQSAVRLNTNTLIWTEIMLREANKQTSAWLCVLVRTQTRGWRSAGHSPGSPDCWCNGSVCRRILSSAGSEVCRRRSAVYRHDRPAGARLPTGSYRENTFSWRHVTLLKDQLGSASLCRVCRLTVLGHLFPFNHFMFWHN